MKNHPTFNPGLPSVSGDLYKVPTCAEMKAMNKAAAASLKERGEFHIPFNGFKRKKKA